MAARCGCGAGVSEEASWADRREHARTQKHIEYEKFYFSSSTLRKVRFFSFKSKTGQTTSLNFKNVHFISLERL
jgi:hypothetical protein